MRYTIECLPFGTAEKVLLKDVFTGNYACVLPEFGAKLNELVLHKNNNAFSMIHGYRSAEEASILALVDYRSAILWPFPNRIQDGKYIIEGVEHQLPIHDNCNGHSLHGLISAAVFEVESAVCTNEYSALSLVHHYAGTEGYYPFSATIKVHYKLADTGLSIILESISNSSKTAFIGMGLHPYFSFNHTNVDDLELQLGRVQRLETEDMIPTGNLVIENTFQDFHTLKDVNLDTGFILTNGINEIKLRSKSKDATIVVQGLRGAEWQYLQLYTPKDRTSIAIEPMTCAADSFNNEMGLKFVDAGDAYRMGINISIE